MDPGAAVPRGLLTATVCAVWGVGSLGASDGLLTCEQVGSAASCRPSSGRGLSRVQRPCPRWDSVLVTA